MRRIHTIEGAPESFTNWLEDNENQIENRLADSSITGDDIWKFFKDDPTSDYNELKRILVEDQGFICCYCGQRIENNHHTSIEHLKPKSKYKEQTLDFDNLFASCEGGSNDIIHVVKTGETLEDIADKFGVNTIHLTDVYVNINEVALFRKKYDLENLRPGDRIVIIPKVSATEQHCDPRKKDIEISITPLDDDCQEKFSFNPFNGEIIETDQNRMTVRDLGLNSNRYLNQLRKKVLDESIFIKENLMNDFGLDKSLFEANRKKLIEALDNIGSPGEKLEPFVFVTIWNLNN